MSSTPQQANGSIKPKTPQPPPPRHHQGDDDDDDEDDENPHGEQPPPTCCKFCRSHNWTLMFPLVTSFSIVYLLFVCYIMGAVNRHFDIFFPLVSDSGNLIPEAATFSLAIFGVGVFFMITATIRYFEFRGMLNPAYYLVRMLKERAERPPFSISEVFLSLCRCCMRSSQSPEYGSLRQPSYASARSRQTAPYCDDDGQVLTAAEAKKYIPKEREKKYRNIKRAVDSQLIIAIIICVSAVGTGSFRFIDSFVAHNAIASGVFICSPIYMTIDAYVSMQIAEFAVSRSIVSLRLLILLFNYLTVGIFGGTMNLLMNKYTNTFINPPRRLFWPPDEPGYYMHVINSIAEWLFLLSLAVYIFTFVFEFRRLKFAKFRLNYGWVEEMEQEELRAGDIKWHPHRAIWPPVHVEEPPAASLDNSQSTAPVTMV